MKFSNSENFTAIDSFSGAGGLSIGLQNAGFNLVYAFDNDEWAVKSYNNHFSQRHCDIRDINMLNGDELLEKVKLLRGELDLFAGGPPCQGFSRQKKGAQNGDNRNKLVLEYARLVNELLPKTLILENVDMLGMKRGESYLKKIFNILDDYTLYPNFYNSADYDLAQTRVRFITVGIRKDIEKEFLIPEKTTKDKRKTIGQVLAGIPEPPVDFTPHPEIFNHQKAKITVLNEKRFSHVPQGGGWQDIPFNLRLKCHQVVDTTKGGWPDVYGRLEWNGQCPTITGGFDSFTRGRYGHPKHNRALTGREAALLQGFPMDFRFMGNRGEVRKQIGNAVPPPLAQAIGTAIINVLNDNYSVNKTSMGSLKKLEKVFT